MRIIIDIKNLSFLYGAKPILNQIGLAVKAGEVAIILGQNGIGKSTLLKLILGFIRPAVTTPQPSINIEGLDAIALPVQARQKMAYLPEQAAAYAHLTGFENLQYFLSLTGKKNVNTQYLKQYLTEAGLQESAWHQRAATYSKGMRQKLMIALALAREVKLLLLDEPNSGLDPLSIAELNATLNRLKHNGVAIVMVTHDISAISEIADSVYVLRNLQLERLNQAIISNSISDIKQIYTPNVTAE